MNLRKKLRKLKDPAREKVLKSFFKTKKGEYGEKDLFLGITVPEQRNLVKRYWEKTSLREIQKLISSKFHEERLTGLLILVKKYENTEDKKLLDFYLKNIKQVNNWDLVDLTAPNILGNFLVNKNKKILYNLAISKNLWERRVAIVSTLAFIRKYKFNETLKISKILLKDKQDLIHKATGWMLREVGKRNQKVLEDFLENNYKKMARTTLRYSIERLPEIKRKYFLYKQ